MTVPPSTVSAPCTRCGGPVPNGAALNDALAEHVGTGRVEILCAACADTSQPAQPSTPTRRYRVGLVIQESTGPALDDWTDVGGFKLEGDAANVAAFVDRYSDEFGQRMEQLLKFADADSTDG
jgi:hypothetical protein